MIIIFFITKILESHCHTAKVDIISFFSTIKTGNTSFLKFPLEEEMHITIFFSIHYSLAF